MPIFHSILICVTCLHPFCDLSLNGCKVINLTVSQSVIKETESLSDLYDRQLRELSQIYLANSPGRLGVRCDSL